MSIKYVSKVGTGVVLLSVLSILSHAQQTTTPSSDSSSQGKTAEAQSPSKDQQSTSSSQQSSTNDQDKAKDKGAPGVSNQGKVAGTSNDRLFYTLPNFLSLENAKQLPPMSAKDKFKVVALGNFDYIQYPWWGILSAISQAEDSEPGYGQGWAAYGKRYGTTAADSSIENFITGAVFPSILHQDPRFYQSSQGGFVRRTGYAVSRIFLTRGDSGHQQFNFSEVFGSALSASISTYSYHPKGTFISTPSNPHKYISSDRTLRNTASVWATQVSLDTITITVKEFWPDIKRKMSHKQKSVQEVAPQ